MNNNAYFEATKFWTNEKVKIPLYEIHEVKLRASQPGGEMDQVLVRMLALDNPNWSGGKIPQPLNDQELLLIELTDGKELMDLLYS